MEETVLAVDLGGTKILVGELTKAGEIIASKNIPLTYQVSGQQQRK